MAIPYREIYYASTQQSLITGADGFGVRTFTQELPKGLIERLKSRNIFLYDSGIKPLAGISELLQNPGLVLEYPETFTSFREEVDGKAYYIFARTVFLGRDYGWYLPEKEESARSGNLFCHAILFLEEDFQQLKPDRAFHALLNLFLPRNCRNNPENEELRGLLTNQYGVPVELPVKYCNSCQQSIPVPAINLLEESVLAVYSALETKRRVVIGQSAKTTGQHLIALLACLPKFVAKSISFATNNHGFNLYTEYTVLFINEFYQRDIQYDHPDLIICDYLKGKFVSSISSDFFEHVRQLIRSGNFDALQEMNEAFDEMAANFTEGMVFNQLFYARLHLLTSERHNYQFKPLAVIQNIKDYALRPEFRNRLEEHILNSFREALSSEQHLKVADSLQLLADLKLERGRWEAAKRLFSAYFFKNDNAAHLFRASWDEELVFNTLILESDAEGIFDFSSQTTLPASVMSVLVRKFCEMLPAETAEGILYSVALNDKITPEFTTDLIKSWGLQRYQFFLKQHEFFVYLGEPIQAKFFGADTQKYLQDFALQGGDALGLIKSKSEAQTFFQQYFDGFAEYQLKRKVSYLDKITLIDFHSYLVIEGFRKWGPEVLMDSMLDGVLKGFEWYLHPSFIEPLVASAQKLSRAASIEKTGLGQNRLDETYLRRLNYCNSISAFITEVLARRLDVDAFIKIVLPLPLKRDDYGNYLYFMLGAIPVQNWLDPITASKIFSYFLGKEKFRNEKFKLNNEALGLVPFIALFYLEQIAEVYAESPELEENLIKFNCTYIQVIWSLKRDKKAVAEDDPKLMPHQIKEQVVSILNRLLDFDKSICKSVIETITEKMANKETGHELIDYIHDNVHTGNTIVGFFKKISSPFKKN